MRPLPCGYSIKSDPRSAARLATGAGETLCVLSDVVEISGAGSVSDSESSSLLLLPPDGSSCALGLPACFTEGSRVNVMPLANLEGITLSTLRTIRVGCEGDIGFTSRVICSKSVGSRSDQGKFVSSALIVQSPLFGKSLGSGLRSMITRRPPDSTQSDISLLSTFEKGILVSPITTTVAGLGPVELNNDEVGSRHRTTSRPDSCRKS